MVKDFDSGGLEEHIGYYFKQKELLAAALTHKSFVYESQVESGEYNERLEFLGDAVLELTVSCFVYDLYPQLPEGDLTRIRAEVVSEKGLAAVGLGLNLGDHLRLGRGEERSGGRHKASLLANAFEALLGAVFRDGGFDAANLVTQQLFRDRIEAAALQSSWTDYKTRLQEYFQGRYGRPPAYRMVSALGPEHDRTYRSEVLFDDQVIGRGHGPTKKAAQQAAAREALSALDT